MIARTAHAPRLLPTALALLMALGACACKKKPKPFPPAPQLVSTATTAAAALSASASAGAGVVVAAPVPGTPTVTAAGSMSPADRAALEQAKASVAELEVMVKKGVTTNPDKPEGGDATAKCMDLETSRAQLEGLADPEGKKVASEVKHLCSFEVPIVSADLALKQVTISPSQASRKLICGFASKDIEKARGVKASDRRVRDLETRFAKACRDALAR